MCVWTCGGVCFYVCESFFEVGYDWRWDGEADWETALERVALADVGDLRDV